MKKLNGYLHLYLASQTDIDALTEHDSECKTYRFIAGLLGLPFIPEKWVKVCAYDADCPNESSGMKTGKSDDWYHSGYIVEGSSGILPFPDYLPADLLKGKKENDILTFRYGDMDVSLTLKQFACDPYQPSDNAYEINTTVSLLQPQTKNHTKSTGQENGIMPIFVPIVLATSGVAGIVGIVTASIATAWITSARAKK